MKVFVLCATLLLVGFVSASPIEVNDNAINVENEDNQPEFQPIEKYNDESEIAAEEISEPVEQVEVKNDSDQDDSVPYNGADEQENEDETAFETDEYVEEVMSQDEMERTFGIEIPNCEQHNDMLYPLHLSHLTDCGKFYKCFNGRGYLMSCPGVEHWSVSLDRCDYRGLAKCKIDGTYQFKIRTATPIQANTEEVDDVDIPDMDESEIDPRCDGSDPLKPLHFQHASDCTKFYKCYLGKAYVIKCPKGQQWSSRLNRCDHASTARCVIKPIAKPVQANAAEEEDDSEDNLEDYYSYVDEYAEPEHTIYDDPDYKIEDPHCTDQDETDRFHPIQFVHPTDCNMFYKCFENFAYKVQCPAGLHFNEKQEICDYPSQAGCNKVGIAAAQQITIPTIPDCPKDSDEQLNYQLDGHPKRYFACMKGMAYMMECPNDELYNPNSHKCESVTVSNGPQFPQFPNWMPQPVPNVPLAPNVPSKPEQPSDGEKDPSDSENNKPAFNFSSGKVNSRCPSSDDPMHPHHLSHETDCSKFYKCFNRRAFLLDCPTGQEWSDELERCDYHMFAKCDPIELIKKKIQM